MSADGGHLLKATIIVPTHNRATYLADTLRSLCEQSISSQEYEIIVVDNASDDGTETVVDQCRVEQKVSIRYIKEGRLGLHFGRNTGGKNALGEILVYVDDDIVADHRWLAALLGPYTDPKVGSVGGKIIPRWEAEVPEWISLIHPGYLSLLNYGDVELELEWPQDLYGCNYSVRREIFLSVRGFNPDGYADRRLIWNRGDGETGFLKKVYETGCRVVYTPVALVEHRIPSSRMTPEYFYRRAFNQGISDAYSNLRLKETPRFFVYMIPRLLKNLVLKRKRSMTSSDGRIILAGIDREYFKAQIGYVLRAATSRTLRAHAMKSDYFE